MAGTACNEHIAKIAALPRGINICVFSPSLLALIKCWKATAAPSRHHVGGNAGRQCYLTAKKNMNLFERNFVILRFKNVT